MNLKILLSISIIILALSASSAEATLDVWINGISFKPGDEVHIGIMIENFLFPIALLYGYIISNWPTNKLVF